MEKKEYLQEGFDAKSLKVAQLRGILSEYEVSFSSNAKKSALVQAFNENIAPNANKLLAEYENSINNANGSGIISIDEEKPKKNSKKRISLKSEKKKEEKEEVEKENEDKKEGKQDNIEKISSPFSKENVFQSPPSSSIPQKRSKSSTQLTPNKKLTKLSPKVNKPRGKLFDDDSEEDSKSEIDLFSESIIINTPKKQKSKSTETKIGKSNEKKDDKKKEKLKKTLDKKVENIKNEETESKVKKELNEEAIAKPSPASADVENEELKEEVVSRVASASAAAFPKFESSIMNKELANELGITVIGLPLADETTPRRVITPKRRATPVNESSESSSKRITPRSVKKDTPNETPKKNTPSKTPKSDTPKSVKEDLKEKTPRKTPRKTPKKTPKKDTPAKVATIDEDHEVDDTVDLLNETTLETPVTPKKSKVSLLKIFLCISVWLIGIMLGYFGWWYREQTFLIGYCGQEIIQDTIPRNNVSTPEWLSTFGEYLDSYKPTCVPCPPHGRCFPLLELSCYNDFIDIQPWYFNLVPYPLDSKRCIPDTKKAEKLEIMIDVAMDLLRSRNAGINCGNTAIEDQSAGLSVLELHDMLLEMKAPYITTEEFEELWKRSLVELEKEPEIIVGFRINNISSPVHSNNTVREEEEENKVLRSTSLSHLSLKCQFLNTIIGSITNHKLEIFTAILILGLIQFIRFKLEEYRLYKKKIGILYSEVLNKLRKQRKLANNDRSNTCPSYIGSTQLRDLILTQEQNLNKKMRLWENVSKKVENNSNIRYLLQENHGEIMKVWEWITDVE